MSSAAELRGWWCQMFLQAQAHYFRGLYFAGFKSQTLDQRNQSREMRHRAAQFHEQAGVMAHLHLLDSEPAANAPLYLETIT